MVQGIRVLNLIIKGALNTRALSKCISIHEGRRRRALCIHVMTAADAYCQAQGQRQAGAGVERFVSIGAPEQVERAQNAWLPRLVLLVDLAEAVLGAQVEHERGPGVRR